MKKLLALTLASLTVVSCATACGKKNDSGKNNPLDTLSPEQNKTAKLSPDEYLDYLLIDNNEIPSAVNKAFDELVLSRGDYAGSVKLDLSIGDGTGSFISAIDNQAGQVYNNNLTWFKNLSLDFDAAVNGTELIKLIAGLSINDVGLAALDFTGDISKGEYYFAVPELSDKTLLFKAPEALSVFELSESVMSIYPDGDAAERMYRKYMQIALDKLQINEKTETELKVGNVSAPVKLISVELTEELVTDMGISIIEAAAVDSDIKAFVTNLASYDEKLGVASADEFISDFYSEMNNTLENLKEKKSTGDFENEKICIDISTNSNDNIVGLKLRQDTAEFEISYAYAENNGVFAHEIIANGTTFLSGNGTVKDNKLSGSYKIADTDGNSIADITLSSFDKKALDDGFLAGSLKVKPAPEFISMLELPAMFGYCDLVIDFKQTTDTAYSMGITLNYNNAKAAALVLSSESKPSSSIALPSNALDAANEASMEEFMSSISLSKIFSGLNEAGAGQLATLIQLAMMNLN